MGQFFKFLFASCLGTALALGLLFFIGIGFIGSLASSAQESTKATVRANSVLELDFKQLSIPEKTNNTELDPFDTENQYVVGLNDMVQMVQKAKEDPDIKGIYLTPQIALMGKASSATLRNALIDFKQSGKFIVAYSDFYTQNAYYMASVADSIFLNPVGAVEFKGYASTISYYKNMLDKLDIQMRIYYAGQFKSATEPFRLTKMSDANRTQVREYLNALYDIFIEDISASRNIDQATLRRLADEYAGRTAESALAGRLIDRVAYEDEALSCIKNKIGLEAKDKLNRISMQDYYSAKKDDGFSSSKDKIAVVYAEGELQSGPKSQPGVIIDAEYVKILRKIRADDRVKAIVLRINSPGGSVLASENILREVQLCKQAGKPVVVSMGDLAASGGYYIACQADSIFAEPGTITGSIGVFGVVPILQKTFENKLGITIDTVKTGKYSAFGSALIDFSEEEGAMIQSRIDATYEDFLRKVSVGRHKTRDEIHAIAQGRVWSGRKAKEIGLVDDIGSLDRAIKSAAALAHLEKYRTTEFPRTKTGLEQLIDKFTNQEDRDASIQASILKAEMGDLYPMYKAMQDMRKLEGIQARLPFEVVIH